MLHFTNTKIKTQLLVVYLIAVFLPILLIGCYLVISTRSLILEEDYARMESDNLRVRSIMVDVTTAIDNVGNIFLSDEELQEIMAYSNRTSDQMYEVYRMYNLFQKYQGIHTEISRIELYLDTPIEYGNFKKVTKVIEQEDWYQNALITAQPLWVGRQYSNTLGVVQNELRYIRRVPIIKTGKYAVLVIAVNNNHLKSRINNNNRLFTDISVNTDIVFYSELPNHKGEPLKAEVDYNKPYFKFSGTAIIEGEETLMEVSTIKPISSSDNIYIVTSDYESIPYATHITTICIAILLFSLLVPFILIALFTTRFNRRILTLRQAMHKASIGDYVITEQIKGGDELRDVFVDMQKMIDSIMRMDQEIYTSKIKEEQLYSHQQRIKYEMLASQINPHFLYNTLETIRMKALSVGAKEVGDAIKLLGKSMRHVLDNSFKTVRLESELEYIRIYLEIQHIRFGDRIHYRIEVEKEIDTKSYYILPLLLQPIVENAVSHGIERLTGEGELIIYIKECEDKLVISVKDNGMGMTEDELVHLTNHMRKGHISTGKNIGLHNIYQRIKLFYGEEYGVTIKSNHEEGTNVTLYLPKESNVQMNLNESAYNR